MARAITRAEPTRSCKGSDWRSACISRSCCGRWSRTSSELGAKSLLQVVGSQSGDQRYCAGYLNLSPESRELRSPIEGT